MKIRAAILEQLGAPLVFTEHLETPPLKPGQVLVALAYSGVCHSQLMEVSGQRGEDRFLPHLLGHEASGKVLEVGENVSKVAIGDHVVLGWIKGHGLDAGGAQYKWGDKIVNAGGVTTFQSHAVVSENRLVKLEKKFPLQVAVLFGCAIPTGAGIVMNSMPAKSDSTILIWGLGGIGLSALLATRLSSFSKIIVVDVETSKLELAKTLGATHLINATTTDPLAEILKITDKRGVDYAVEAAGLSSTIEKSFDAVKKGGGLCVFASHPKFGDKIKLDPFDLISGKRIQGTWGGECFPDRDVPKFVELYRSGQWPIDLFFGKKYKLEQVNEAMKDLADRKVTRALLEIDPSLQSQ